MILNIHEAVAYFIEMVRSGKTKLGKGADAQPTGRFGGKNYLVYLLDVSIPTAFGIYAHENYYLFFKRKWFEKFALVCNFPKQLGMGMTVSYDPLLEAEREKAFIAVVMEDGEIYDLHSHKWLKWIREYEHHEVIRVMNAGNNGQNKEASIPASLLRRLYPL